MQRTRGSYSSGRYAAITANIVMKAIIAPRNPRNISNGSPVASSATIGNIHSAAAAHPARHNGRRPYRSPSSAATGVSEPFTSTAAMMQVSMTARLTPSRSVP